MAAAGQQTMTQGELNIELWHACGRGNDLPRVGEMLDRGADPNALVLGGANALHRAAWCGRLELAKTLLGRGAVLETRSDRGTSALLWAALWAHLEMCLFWSAQQAEHDRWQSRTLAPVLASRGGELQKLGMWV